MAFPESNPADETPDDEAFVGLALLPIAIDDIRRSVSLASFERGQDYQRAGRALLEEVESDGSGLSGWVQGTREKPYRVIVTIKKPAHTGPGGRMYPIIEGDCSCPVGYNCKHAVALMLVALIMQQAAQAITASSHPSVEEADSRDTAAGERPLGVAPLGMPPPGMALVPSQAVRTVVEAAVPLLRLFQRTLLPSSYRQRQGYDDPVVVPLARLSFLYDGIELPGDHDSLLPTVLVAGEVVAIRRQVGEERNAQARLADLGFERLADRNRWQIPPEARSDLTLFFGNADDYSEQWLEFLTVEVPLLRTQGWLVEIGDDFPFRLATLDGDGVFDAEITPGTGIDWFELNLGIVLDGERVDILPALLRVLAHLPTDGLAEFLEDDANDGDIIYLRLPDERICRSPLPVCARSCARCRIFLTASQRPLGRCG